jgi:hypothetical protein
MSKMDDLRAMREARYEQSRVRARTTAPAAPARPATTATVSRPEQAAVLAVVPDPPEAEPALCGHRNMSGRTCTREAGHAAKSHRYS